MAAGAFSLLLQAEQPTHVGREEYAVGIESLAHGEEVGEGTDLGIDGYNSLKAQGNVLYGDAAVYVDAETAADYPF